MGLYVTSIMGGAALAAAISPFVSLTTSWQVALNYVDWIGYYCLDIMDSC